MKKYLRIFATCLVLPFVVGTLTSAHASLMQIDGSPLPSIIAGNEVDVDGAPVVPAGMFTGVVSISIEIDSDGYICTGSVISKRHIITAAHCVETMAGVGQVIDITQPGFGLLAAFNDGGVINNVISAESVAIHPDYLGFAVCGPDDVGGFFGDCLNDDIAVITLSEDIPDGIEIYDFARDTLVDSGTLLTMVGHGVSGDGYWGESIDPSFSTKRFGFNIAEYFDCDDGTTDDLFSGGFQSSLACDALYGNQAEVWYADFDGYDSFLDDIDGAGDGFIDTFCELFGTGCGNGLGDDLLSGLFEAAIGGGDSGGPSFIYDALTDKFLLAANNTFGTNGQGPFGIPGAFGEIFGGNLYAPYLDWIDTNFLFPLLAKPVPAPSVFGLLLIAIGLISFKGMKKAK